MDGGAGEGLCTPCRPTQGGGGGPRAEGGEVDSCRGGGDVRVVLKTLVVENQRARGVTGDEGALCATATWSLGVGGIRRRAEDAKIWLPEAF